MIILASTSARRQDILKRFVDYKIITKDIEFTNTLEINRNLEITSNDKVTLTETKVDNHKKRHFIINDGANVNISNLIFNGTAVGENEYSGGIENLGNLTIN